MISTTLKDGTIKHTSPGWTGYQKPGEGYYKTKWYKDDTNYWTVEGSKTIYNITMDKLGRFTCECVGFKFRKNCKHIKKIKKKA